MWVAWLALVAAAEALQFVVFPCSAERPWAVAVGIPALGIPVAALLSRFGWKVLPAAGRARTLALVALGVTWALAAPLWLLTHVCM